MEPALHVAQTVAQELFKGGQIHRDRCWIGLREKPDQFTDQSIETLVVNIVGQLLYLLHQLREPVGTYRVGQQRCHGIDDTRSTGGMQRIGQLGRGHLSRSQRTARREPPGVTKRLAQHVCRTRACLFGHREEPLVQSSEAGDLLAQFFGKPAELAVSVRRVAELGGDA